MLSLDSPEWTRLQHAYGPAGDIPELLERFQEQPDEEDWDELWSCLCHQYTTYSATYAALLHIADIARTRPSSEWGQFLSFAGTVIACTKEGDVPDAYRADVARAVESFRALAGEAVLNHPHEQPEFVMLLESLAALHGSRTLGLQLSRLNDEEFQGVCPHCEAELFITVEAAAMTVTVEDPVFHPQAKRTAVVPASADAPPWTPSLLHHVNVASLRALAGHVGHPRVAEWLRYLEGRGSCPACGGSFELLSVIDAGEDQEESPD
ncbi:hypothetical protein ATI61_110390 [Archangium gephyra]|uniref:Uncharacterized protein n=1 Tax=Archangium gephyra TaxID=48 RepID=A0AAC8QE55_9BACT|nr:hypothetical protein [Archangium gephyra]AKJ05861.1 Hypothetical protein AA314_07487 [Archangium gephyra]REG27383.1 hypothetical protein ATI61_110390 [Archangium gephyra]